MNRVTRLLDDVFTWDADMTFEQLMEHPGPWVDCRVTPQGLEPKLSKGVAAFYPFDPRDYAL